MVHKEAEQWTNTLKDLCVARVRRAASPRRHRPSTEGHRAALANQDTDRTRVRNRVELVLDWVKSREYRSGENPARWSGHLDKVLPKRSHDRPDAR